jgi:ABC-type branched-subunit amino acid transport system substrate-binding protein
MFLGVRWIRVCSSIALAALAVGVSACGSSSKSSSSTSASSATTTASGTASGTPLKLMQIYEQDSPYQDYHTLNGGAAAAILDINSHGGIAGHPLELVACDDNTEPNRAIKCARQAVREKVWAVAASSTLFESAVGAIIGPAKIPYVGSWLNGSYSNMNPNNYPIAANNTQGFAGAAYALTLVGAKKIAVISLTGPESSDEEGAIEAIPKFGATKLGPVDIPLTATDFAPYVVAAQKLGAEGVVIVASIAVDVGFLKAAHTLGVKFKYAFQVGDFTANNLAAIGSEAANVVAAGVMPPSNDPGSTEGAKKFEADMEAARQAGVKNVEPKGPGEAVSINGWVDPWALKLLSEKHPEAAASSSALIEVLNKETAGVNVFGLLTWKPGEKGPAQFPRITNSSVWLCKVEHGEFVLSQPEPVNVFEKLGIS